MNDFDKTKEELIVELTRLREENLLLKSVHKSRDIQRVLAQNKFQMLSEQSPIGMALVLHETGELLEVNNSILKSTGYPNEKIVKLL